MAHLTTRTSRNADLRGVFRRLRAPRAYVARKRIPTHKQLRGGVERQAVVDEERIDDGNVSLDELFAAEARGPVGRGRAVITGHNSVGHAPDVVRIQRARGSDILYDRRRGAGDRGNAESASCACTAANCAFSAAILALMSASIAASCALVARGTRSSCVANPAA